MSLYKDKSNPQMTGGVDVSLPSAKKPEPLNREATKISNAKVNQQKNGEFSKR